MKDEKKYKDLESITPIDIAEHVKWTEVKNSLLYYYPNFKWGKFYESVFNHLKKYKKAKGFEGGKLEVLVGGFLNFEMYLEEDSIHWRFYSIHIKKDKLGDFPSYSMSFVPWIKLANTPFEKETLRRYTYEECMAHFIYEITWYGPEKKMMKEGKEILGTAKKCIDNLKKK